MLTLSSLLAAAGMASLAAAHGVVTSPPVRAAGPAMIAACGSAVTNLVSSDPTSHVEGLPEAAATTPNFDATACNVFLCKGLQFGDNGANVQKFTAGQVVNILASIPIPHEGPANVSIVDTTTNTVIGNPLIVFDSYADERLATLPANNTNFDVTIPDTWGSKCAVAGTCVLQWFWFGTGAQQTYESCVDFTVGEAAAAVPAADTTAPVEVAVSTTAPIPAATLEVSTTAIAAEATPVSSAEVSSSAASSSETVTATVDQSAVLPSTTPCPPATVTVTVDAPALSAAPLRVRSVRQRRGTFAV
jgi:hypothetical protein